MIDLRILIVADDPLARAGLATLLSGQPDCHIVGQIASDDQLPDKLTSYYPDVILWDLGWEPNLTPALVGNEASLNPSSTTLDLLLDLEELDIPTIILIPDETYLPQIWSLHIQGFLLRHVNPEMLVAALQAAAQKLVVMPPELLETLLPTSNREVTDDLVEALTPRELEVLQHLAEGLSNKAIAQVLVISEHTVKFHVNALMGKLNAQSRTEAVVRATRLGLILL